LKRREWEQATFGIPDDKSRADRADSDEGLTVF